MREMSLYEFHELLATYISQISKEYDFKDEETVIFSPEFDALVRHIQSRPNAKLKLTYVREDADIRLLYKQLLSKLSTKNTLRIM